jgi:hypothetical protein
LQQGFQQGRVAWLCKSWQAANPLFSMIYIHLYTFYKKTIFLPFLYKYTSGKLLLDGLSSRQVLPEFGCLFNEER